MSSDIWLGLMIPFILQLQKGNVKQMSFRESYLLVIAPLIEHFRFNTKQEWEVINSHQNERYKCKHEWINYGSTEYPLSLGGCFYMEWMKINALEIKQKAQETEDKGAPYFLMGDALMPGTGHDKLIIQPITYIIKC